MLTECKHAGFYTDGASGEAYAHLLWKKVAKGQIVVNLGNPVLSANSFGWLFNALFLAMSRNVIIDTSLTAGFTTIPALEQVGLSVAVNFKNLFNDTLTYYFSSFLFVNSLLFFC